MRCLSDSTDAAFCNGASIGPGGVKRKSPALKGITGSLSDLRVKKVTGNELFEIISIKWY